MAHDNIHEDYEDDLMENPVFDDEINSMTNTLSVLHQEWVSPASHHEMPPPPPEPPPLQDESELANITVTTIPQTPLVCDTDVSGEDYTGWNIASELQYYSDNSEECENTWSTQLKSKVKTIVNNLFTAAKNPILRPDPVCKLP